MYCKNCGAEIADGAKFCTSCGTKMEEAAPAAVGAAPVMEPVPYGGYAEPMTKKEFYNLVASKKTKGWVTTMAVICYVTAGLSLFLILGGNFISLLDVALYVTMGVLLQKTRSWVFALVPTIYSTFFSLVALIGGGMPGGILALIAGIISTKALKKIDTAYTVYRTQGVFPPEQI